MLQSAVKVDLAQLEECNMVYVLVSFALGFIVGTIMAYWASNTKSNDNEHSI